MFRTFRTSNSPCDILYTTEECFGTTFILTFSCCAMLAVQIALSIDRVISLLAPKFFETHIVVPCFILTLLTVVISISIPITLFDENAAPETVPNCFYNPLYMKEPLHKILAYCTMAIILCILINISVIVMNMQLERRIRYDITIRYRQREALLTSQFVCWISIVLFVAYCINTLGGLLARIYRNQISAMAYNYIFLILYTFPFAAALTPAFILLASWHIKRQRKRVIRDLTEARDTMGSRMHELSDMWTKSYEEKKSSGSRARVHPKS
ncbi:unnamed protein product [Caenorhabditis auriculariae]|uniref:Uncharacterized protein n=1 Tax=Caenorhabditis auriculariae TaxID=2777116 RepID=A0A8S1HQ24_9PELO|nr:unnamed protein product [Caenorhabditis auriculariae]